MSRSRAAAVAAFLGFWGSLTGLTAPAANAEHGTHLDLVAQTTFVGDRPAVIRVGVTDAAATDRLTVRILAPRTTRSGVRAAVDAIAGEDSLSFFAVDTEFRDGSQEVRIRIPDEEVGELLRDSVGALPVLVELRNADGEIRDTLLTHLLVIDDAVPLHLGFVADLTAPLARQVDQSASLDLGEFVSRVAAVDAHPVPVSVAILPETLEALAVSATPDDVNAVREALANRPVLRSPWVALDEEGWRQAGEPDIVIEHYARGAGTIEQLLGDSPTTVVQLDPDTTPSTLGLLRTAGATAALAAPTNVSTATRAATGQRPVQILDNNGLGIPVLTFDDELHETLLGPDPELAGHRAVAELAMLAAESDAPLAVVARSDGIDPVALEILADAFADRPWLRTRAVERLFDVDPARDDSGAIARGALRSDPAPDLRSRATDIALTAGLVDSYATMVAPAEGPIAPLRDQLLAAASVDLDHDEALAYTAAVFDEVLAGTEGLSIVPSERITLTDRRADLPLTLRNDQPLPIRIELILSAAKIRFPDGEQLSLVLQPGENQRTIRVETLASGDARITATLTSPDGRLELSAGSIDIRSTAISGLGLVISIAALLVLGGWWARTVLRVRRTRAAATVAPEPDSGPSLQRGEP